MFFCHGPRKPSGEAYGLLLKIMFLQRQSILVKKKPQLQNISILYPSYEYILKLKPADSPDKLAGLREGILKDKLQNFWTEQMGGWSVHELSLYLLDT